MGWQLTDPLAQISVTCPGDPRHGVMPNAPVLVREQSSTEWFAPVLTVIPNGPCLALGDSEAVAPEHAVFVLHDVLQYSRINAARLLEPSVANVDQLLRGAWKHMETTASGQQVSTPN